MCTNFSQPTSSSCVLNKSSPTEVEIIFSSKLKTNKETKSYLNLIQPIWSKSNTALELPRINSSPLVGHMCAFSVSDCGISSKWPIIMPRLLIQASPELTVHFWPAGGRGGRLEVKLVSFPWNLLENISATFLSVVFGNQCTNPAVTNLTYKLLRPSIQGIGDFSSVITKSVSHELLRR